MALIIHISNTDIEFDSRIRKELLALSTLSQIRIAAIGVADSNLAAHKELNGASLHNLSLWSRKLRWLPRAIRYFFELIEFTIRVYLMAKKMADSGKLSSTIAHCHDTFALPSGYLLKTFFGSKLVYDAHELESNKNGQNKILSLATLGIEKFCWPKIDLLVSVSDAIIEWYSVNFTRKSSVLVLNSPMIAEGTQRPISRTEKKYFHEKFNIPHDHKVFVYLGILAPGRGIEVCLESFKQTTGNVCIIFVGFGSLETIICDHASHSNKIFFHPAVPHDQVVGLVSHADFGVCLIENVSLSDYLCLPNKLFEYSFAGLPILASDFPEIRKVVDKYSLGICCCPTVDDLTTKLSELDKIEFSHTRESIYALSWQVQAARLREAYSSLLRN